jgi:XTP/dITP diphosphohydrolase
MEVNQTLAALQELINVVVKLRFLRSASLSPEGCPWDLAQTPSSLTPYVIEEAYEVVDAIQTGDKQAIAEELGDLLLQVVLQAQIASEAGDFSLQEVAEGIAKKLIRRHLHVFADVNAVSMEEVQKNWETIKAAEKGETLEEQKLSDKLNRYRRSLPPLNAAMKISEKAAKVGFEWNNVEEVWGKFHEELGEFQQALAEETKERQESELGDLLFAIIQVARWHKLDPSAGLQGTSQRFIQRVQKIETMIERPLTDYSLEELDALWQQAKAQLANRNI